MTMITVKLNKLRELRRRRRWRDRQENCQLASVVERDTMYSADNDMRRLLKVENISYAIFYLMYFVLISTKYYFLC